MRVNWAMIFSAIRNTLLFFGIVGIIAWVIYSPILQDVIGGFFFIGTVSTFYFFETRWRELRLRKGWYL